MPIRSTAFETAPHAAARAPGLPTAIDIVAEAADTGHRFLRRQWFAAAIEAYGGDPWTLTIARGATPLIALPTISLGPHWLGVRQVPGSYWPFRSFPARADAGREAFAALAAALARSARGLRIGPVYDDDRTAHALLEAMRGAGWTTLDRRIAETMRLDLAGLASAGDWPRGSTLRKNRFHEKHLAAHGALGWRFVRGTDWPAAFDAFAMIEASSWIARDTDGRDAKFQSIGHGAFWHAAARDPVLAEMFSGALLTIDGAPAAFSFDIDAGALRYAIANSYAAAIAKHSPGKLLQYRNLADALDRGTAVVDWGAGDSGYKATLGAQEDTAIRDWIALRPGLPAWVGRGLVRWWRRSGQ